MTEGADLLAHKPVSKIRHESGFAYIARTWHPELSAHKLPSSAVVLEDGVPLPGPADALHDDIRQLLSTICWACYFIDKHSIRGGVDEIHNIIHGM